MPTLIAAVLLSILHAAEPAPAEQPLPPGVIAVVLDTHIIEAERDDLDAIVLWLLVTQFARDNNLAPTKEEVDALTRRMNEIANRHLVELRERCDLLKGHIEGNENPDDPKLDAAKAELVELESTLQNLLGAANGNPAVGPGQWPEAIARRRFAKWKINKALFDRYGGRVEHSVEGGQPIDAYRQFLKDQEAAGAFRFADEATRDAFWAEWNDDAARRWMEEGTAKRYFDKPWWLGEEPK